MITEDYVSFETSKLLKEKGFDTAEIDAYFPFVYYSDGKMDFYDDDNPLFVCEVPTLQMAMKWLRIEHNIFVCVLLLEESNEFGYTIENLIKKKYITTSKNSSYKDPEEACEAAIKYCLEHLI